MSKLQGYFHFITRILIKFYQRHDSSSFFSLFIDLVGTIISFSFLRNSTTNKALGNKEPVSNEQFMKNYLSRLELCYDLISSQNSFAGFEIITCSSSWLNWSQFSGTAYKKWMQSMLTCESIWFKAVSSPSGELEAMS